MAEQSTGRVTVAPLTQVTADLDAYIEARAGRVAEEALTHANNLPPRVGYAPEGSPRPWRKSVYRPLEDSCDLL